jgi:hypothetical protein
MEHPAKQFKSNLPSLLSVIERLGFVSSWAGQQAEYPDPDLCAVFPVFEFKISKNECIFKIASLL